MKRRLILALIAFFVVTLVSNDSMMLVDSASQVETFVVEDVSIKVYRDGVVLVQQALLVNETMPSVTTSLFTISFANILVLDEEGGPLPYEVAASDITVTTLGSTRVTLEYLTSAMTEKEHDTWTFRGEVPYEFTLSLPENAMPIYVSQPPLDMTVEDERVIFTMPEGSWEISYVVSFATTPVTTSITTRTTPTSTIPSSDEPLLIDPLYGVALAAVAAVAVAAFILFRKRKGFGRLELRPEDKKVLEFLSEKGGAATEAELRQKFLLPKTSMWRLVKRLERMGLVRVKRVGVENQVELVG